MVTKEFIPAFIVANKCGSNPRLIFNLYFDNNATPTNTIIETSHINDFAFYHLYIIEE
jgi:hypothetical protein